MIKTAGTVEYMGLVLGSFLAPQTDMIFGDGVRPPLFEVLIANSVLVCVTLMRFAQLKKVLGWLKTGPPRRHRMQPDKDKARLGDSKLYKYYC